MRERVRDEYRAPRPDGTVHGAAFSRREALLVPDRYTPERKRQLVEAVEAGVASFDEVATAHRIHPEEWAMWVAGFRQQRHQGMRELRRSIAAEAAP